MNDLGVIFDMDGVLVDSYRAHLQSWQVMARQHDLQMSEADFARTFGKTSREIIRQLWPGRFNDEQVIALDAEKEAAYRDVLRQHFPEMAGASELIASLHASGFRLAIGSSGPAENVELVRRLIGGGQYIRAIVHGTEVKHGKPDPQIFLLAAEKLGLAAEKCAVIEDAFVGLEAARRAGMAAIGLVGTATAESMFDKADRVVEFLRDLTPQMIANVIAEHQRQGS